ncbi:type II toxin-antitoxin system HicA family toxin [Phormidesmis priestleyi]|uniref:type II toxin-antitoxin system HicA family toxin n=1 Tax=Phormidesmis priestleyi TaxID=268141 RepID=UPI000A75256D|nr:type II toxin-antitoxin system HicA family toxin [Phormidesmis priestleyi]
MAKFPVDAPKAKVIKVLEGLGFSIVREKEHISMVRQNPDGTNTPLTLPTITASRVLRSEVSALNLAFHEMILLLLMNKCREISVLLAAFKVESEEVLAGIGGVVCG